MNPVLLKPETDVGAQVVVQGRRLTTVRARDYAALKPALMGAVLESFGRLKAAHDLVIVEGAGSPAEVNLRAGDIANMGFAQAAGVPVVLAGDIDRGGVIAQIIGTQAVLDPADAALVAGFLINKFRGDPSLFDEGYRLIEARTGWRGFGTLPWFAEAGSLPAEDALDLRSGRGGGALKVACLALSRIANFDDLDPLKLEPAVSLTMVGAGQAVPGDTDLLILPGSKSTRGDLEFLRAQGWDVDIHAHVRRGGRVRRLSDAGPGDPRPRRDRRAAGRKRGPWPSGCRNPDDARQAPDADGGGSCAHRRRDGGLRDPYRPHRRP
jgi:adenosylcobyric acid synthase